MSWQLILANKEPLAFKHSIKLSNRKKNNNNNKNTRSVFVPRQVRKRKIDKKNEPSPKFNRSVCFWNNNFPSSSNARNKIVVLAFQNLRSFLSATYLPVRLKRFVLLLPLL